MEEGDPDNLPGTDDTERATTRAKAIMKCIEDIYNLRASHFPPDALAWLERYIMLNSIDTLYQDHLYAMDDLRNSVHLRSYAQRDPLGEYKSDAYKLFDALMTNIKEQICTMTFRIAPVIVNGPGQGSVDVDENEEVDVNDVNITMQGEIPGAAPVQKTAESPEIQQLRQQLEKPRPQVTTNHDDYSQFDDLMTDPNEQKQQAGPARPVHRQVPKVGRNDPCPCGSGKKYKNCCGRNA